MKPDSRRFVSAKIRLNRFLSQCSLGSRRKCDELIAGGHIYCNGEQVAKMGMCIDPIRDRIEYKGKLVRPVAKHEYLIYYKPQRTMVTADDPEGRPTIYTVLLSNGYDIRHLRYVGRLDYNSEGLLILTNDGDLIHALTHPRFNVKKVYHVKVQRRLSNEEIKQLLDGVESRGEELSASSIQELTRYQNSAKRCWYEITLYEGKNRHIRRMFESISVAVSRIKRVQFGPVKIGKLKPGEIRPLNPREIKELSGFCI